jgi:hypothetical protein
MPLFKLAAEQWLVNRAGLAPRTLETYRTYVRTLIDRFGGRLVSDFSEDDIATLIRARQADGFKPRRINFELAVLRMVLRDFRIWDNNTTFPVRPFSPCIDRLAPQPSRWLEGIV